MPLHPSAGFVLAILLAPSAHAQNAQLVADINQAAVPTDSDVSSGSAAGFLQIGGKLVVAADDGVHGRELFVVDPATRKHELLIDIRVGAEGSEPQQFALAQGLLWFSADDGVHGRELWASDGTRAGTRLVADLFPGAPSSSPGGMTACGQRVVFGAIGPNTGIELFVSDGTAAGSGLLREFAPGVGIFDGFPRDFAADASGSRVYFSANSQATGREVWVTDGSAQGTVLVADLLPGKDSSFPTRLTTLGSRVVGTTSSGVVFAADATSGAQVLHAGQAFLFDPVRSGNRILFAGFDATHGREPWVTDGTPAGTRLLVDAVAGSTSSEPSAFTRGPGPGAFFFTQTPTNTHVWTSDGTSAGTRVVASMPRAFAIKHAAFASGTLFFQARSLNPSREELFSWTGQGLQQVALPSSLTLDPRPLFSAIAAGRIAFAARDALLGRELFEADGSAARVLADIRPPNGRTQSSDPVVLGSIASLLVFSANDGAAQPSLWGHDSATKTTQKISDVTPVLAGATIGNRIVFSASSPATGHEVFVTDGTRAGTHVLVEFEPGAASSVHGHFRRVRGAVYFSAYRRSSGRHEIWQSDGTVAGTKLYVVVPAGVARPHDFVRVSAVGRGLLFLSDNKIFVTDGTTSGTRPLGGVAAQVNSPSMLTRVGDRAFFRGNVLGVGIEVGMTDGTDSGTVMGDLEPGPRSSDPQNFVLHDGKLLFTATRNFVPTIFESDGTAAGTRPVLSRTYTQYPHALASGGSRHFYFRETDASAGDELWRSDGSDAGTGRYVDVHAGPLSSNLSTVFVHDGALYASAMTLRHGFELWRIESDAASIRVGAACSTRAIAPSLDLEDAVLGKTAEIRVQGAQLGDIMALVSGVPSRARYPLTPECFLEVDLLLPFGSLALPVQASSWSARIDVPNVAALHGLTTAWQCVFLRASPIALETSNGVHATLGAR